MKQLRVKTFKGNCDECKKRKQINYIAYGKAFCSMDCLIKNDKKPVGVLK